MVVTLKQTLCSSKGMHNSKLSPLSRQKKHKSNEDKHFYINQRYASIQGWLQILAVLDCTAQRHCEHTSEFMKEGITRNSGLLGYLSVNINYSENEQNEQHWGSERFIINFNHEKSPIRSHRYASQSYCTSVKWKGFQALLFDLLVFVQQGIGDTLTPNTKWP